MTKKDLPHSMWSYTQWHEITDNGRECKRGVYMYNWITLLYTWICHNIVNHPYFNKKNFKDNRANSPFLSNWLCSRPTCSDDRTRLPYCSDQTCHCFCRRHIHGSRPGPLGADTSAAAREPTSSGLASFPFAWIEHEGDGKEAAKIPPAPGSPHTRTSIHLSTQHGCPDLRRRSLEMLSVGWPRAGGEQKSQGLTGPRQGAESCLASQGGLLR